ncbi:hypothetical protein P4131_31355 [Pseudomonas aeruginosa]|nr:hypothetical protein [Pseudomonas aeruginosa]
MRAVITEHGELRCSTAILAGGAWSSLFCRNLGIRLPQLKVIASVLRTQPMPGGPEHAVGAGNYAFRKRLDGGYSIAQRSANIAPITPDSLRYCHDFLPALGKQYRELRLRFGRTFFEECRLPNHWALDQVSPFERCRVLDPQPSAAILRGSPGRAQCGLPVLSQPAGAADLGRGDGCHPGRRAGAWPSRQPARLAPGHRFLRPWLRHRPRRRPPAGRPDRRQPAAGRPDALAARA